MMNSLSQMPQKAAAPGFASFLATIGQKGSDGEASSPFAALMAATAGTAAGPKAGETAAAVQALLQGSAAARAASVSALDAGGTAGETADGIAAGQPITDPAQPIADIDPAPPAGSNAPPLTAAIAKKPSDIAAVIDGFVMDAPVVTPPTAMEPALPGKSAPTEEPVAGAKPVPMPVAVAEPEIPVIADPTKDPAIPEGDGEGNGATDASAQPEAQPTDTPPIDTGKNGAAVQPTAPAALAVAASVAASRGGEQPAPPGQAKRTDAAAVSKTDGKAPSAPNPSVQGQAHAAPHAAAAAADRGAATDPAARPLPAAANHAAPRGPGETRIVAEPSVARPAIDNSAAMTVLFTQNSHAAAGTSAVAEAAGPAPVAEQILDLGSDDAWIDQLARDIAATKSQSGEISFRLMPRHLGRLDVAMTQGDEGVALKLDTQHEATASIVQAAQTKLVEDLRQQGVRVTGAEVTHTPGEAGRQSQQGQGRGQGHDPAHLIETAPDHGREDMRSDSRSADRRGRFA